MKNYVVGLQKYGYSHRQAFKATTHFCFYDTDAVGTFYFKGFAVCKPHLFFSAYLCPSKFHHAIHLLFEKSTFAWNEFPFFYSIP
jgi:hypothetical protein